MMNDIVANVVLKSWLVLGEMAPFLWFGFLAAKLLSCCVSPA